MGKQKIIINREISWLSFNERVLQEASDPAVPLMERIKFLGIFSNNLDEFFKVRVATLKRMIDIGKGSKSLIDESPKVVLNKIQNIVIKQQEKFDKIYRFILNQLKKQNIFIINENQIKPEQENYIKEYFEEKVMPVISPIMLSEVSSFPNLRDKSIYLAVKLTKDSAPKKPEYALIEIPTSDLSRFIVLPAVNDKKYIILLDDVIRYNLSEVFYIFNFDHFEAYTIKITRDAELDIDNDLSVSFLEKISKSVKDRTKGQPVRFVYDSSIAPDLLRYLTRKLKLGKDDNFIPGARYHNFKDFMGFPNIGTRDMEYTSCPPVPHSLILTHNSILDLIASQDLLLHFPYHKFAHFINFLREAAIDPNVKKIKITLYRIAKNSKVIAALINAARNGKEVTVVVELQARFDESTNIYWSKKLEEAGAKVLFGVRGLKVHSKLVSITRVINNQVVNYACISTGNFHEDNARIYSDVFFFTIDKRIALEVQKIFDFFENIYKNYTYRHLLVSPLYMRKRLVKLIDNEIKNARAQHPAYIILKINNLVDSDMIKKLYQANNAGVKIKLIVRGICSLIPGIPGMSENIEAISIVDRFLEHSRIFIFCNNNKELYYISSADWMTRNLDHRIEVACPIYDKNMQKELRIIIDTQLRDNVKARIIDKEQNNEYKTDNSGKEVRSQIELYNYYKNLS